MAMDGGLSLAGFAQATGRSAEFIRRLLRDGRLPGYKVPGQAAGGEWRLPIEAIDVLSTIPQLQPRKPRKRPVMATAPAEREPEPTPIERVRDAIVKPVSEKQRAVTLLAISAGLVALAPVPFGPAGAALLVLVAADHGRKR